MSHGITLFRRPWVVIQPWLSIMSSYKLSEIIDISGCFGMLANLAGGS